MSNENIKDVFYISGDFLEVEQDYDLPPTIIDQCFMGLMHKKASPSVTISTRLDYYGVDGRWEPSSDKLWRITVEKVVEPNE